MNRWNSLGLGVAFTAAFFGPQALAQETSEAPADAVALEADDITSDDDTNEVIAEGNVVATYQARTLRADKVVYNRETRRVHASGNVQIFDPDGTQRFADEIDVDEKFEDGYASNFSTRMPSGGVAIARSAVREGNGKNSLEKVVYTACPVCEDGKGTPTWSLRARRATLDQNSQMISYRDVVLEIAGIPVFYLPWFTHPDPTSERRSGLLTPDFGTSSKLGAFYSQPYYYTISKSSDITVTPSVYTNVNPLLEIDYRKRFYSGQLRLEVSGTKEREFDSDGEKFGEAAWRSHLYGAGRFAINNTWQWGFGAELVSDDLYTRRYDIDGEGDDRGLYNSQPRRLLSQLYTVGQSRNFYADASFLRIQGLRAGDDDAELPTVTPLLFAERNFELGGFGNLAVNASSAVLNRDVGADSRRVSLGLDWTTSAVLPGGFVLEPFVQARGDYYSLDEDISGKADVSRAVGTAGAELSWPLLRTTPDVSILIEPTAMVAWSPSDPNDPAIPNEDGLLFEMDDVALLSPNAAPGYDLYEGGARAAVAVQATATWNGGLQARALAGRRWKEEIDPAFSALSGLDEELSDWITSVGVSYKDNIAIEARMRLDDDEFNLNRIDLRSFVDIWRLRASVRYFRFDEVITGGRPEEAVQIGGEFNVTDQISLIYLQVRDIAGTPIALRDPITDQFLRDPVTNAILFDDRPRDLTRSIGIAFTDECSRFEIAFTRSEAIDRSIGPNDTIEFRFFLRSLGAVGGDEFD